ncbi:MAG TPA: CBS domain-containing protein [Methylomirabilota bacterium]|nr:CBS domain-containing protein [Methylomirabilota bacterium]
MIAGEAMTPAPLTVTPRTSVAAALRLARDNGIGHLPVVERGLIVARRLLERGAPEALVVEEDRLVGILTHSDLLRALIPAEPEAAA